MMEVLHSATAISSLLKVEWETARWLLETEERTNEGFLLNTQMSRNALALLISYGFNTELFSN